MFSFKATTYKYHIYYIPQARPDVGFETPLYKAFIVGETLVFFEIIT